MLDTRFEKILSAVVSSAIKQGEKFKPAPMGVAKHENILDDNSPIEKSWIVEGGVCGFVWIEFKSRIKNTTNYKFKKWCIENSHILRSKFNIGYYYSNYSKSNTLSISHCGQSLERNLVVARIIADALRDSGLQCTVQNRLD